VRFWFAALTATLTTLFANPIASPRPATPAGHSGLAVPIGAVQRAQTVVRFGATPGPAATFAAAEAVRRFWRAADGRSLGLGAGGRGPLALPSRLAFATPPCVSRLAECAALLSTTHTLILPRYRGPPLPRS
jgi:hypothetical protein